MLRILHLFNEYLPRTETWAYDLISHCPNAEHFIAAQYYNHLDQYSDSVTILNKSIGLAKMKRAKQSKFDFPRNVFGSLFSLQSLFLSEKSIAKLVIEYKIDIIHCHFGTTAIEQWDDIKDLDMPLVVSFYGWDYAKAIHVNPSYMLAYSEIFQKVGLLLTEGSAGAERLVKLSADPSKIKSLPLGVEINHALPVKRDFKAQGKLRLIQIASIAEKKGQLLTLRAFHKVRRKYPDQVTLTLIGDDRDIYYAEDVKNLMSHEDIKDQITYFGWVDSKTLISTMQDYDVFIHPSQHAADGDCEGGSPVILLQAQASGLPVIATEHCDIPEQVQHGKSGYLAPEGDVEALVDIIELFIAMSAEEYAQMSAQAILWARDNFDLKLMGAKLATYYAELAEP